MQKYTREEVARHAADFWVIINGKVYDLSKFASLHPGGKRVLEEAAGKDATSQFITFHSDNVLVKYDRFCIGYVGDPPSPVSYPETLDATFGSSVPYAEPYWYREKEASPYYTENHATFRAKVRRWVDSVQPMVSKWEAQKDYPREMAVKAYEAGVFGACWPERYGGTPPKGGYDGFMDLVFWDELSRAGGGWLISCFFTLNIALPPILNWGSEEMKQHVGRECITGQKIMSLAISEPHVGSDVANLQTTATRQGDHFILRGEKKFITSGMKADYFTVACRTGGKGMKGVSLLLVERTMPGISTRKLSTQGWHAGNTAYIIFENVKVPVSNLIGEENKGFLYIMHNFNHERFVGVAMGLRGSRRMIEESVRYATNRRTFGKRLIDHQVIRHKIAEMVRLVESTQAWLEQLVFQMETGQMNQARLGGTIALLKVHTTKMTELCAREASQILGGNSVLKSGPGENVERFYRDVRIGAIGGGSEEVMTDLAMNQAFGRPKL
mmetsp:Transcript_29530/g.82520  ORF Transcript_29530/g.82520 Transcript_29530/m.82520 type:complete len:498 (+) Transcript_29530:230-1723(+)|eukprot:CAMPEP_0119153188 /NCGR_PEP_ID=MMETSP1310-20130426/48840_1 /TAXON_ID=464262 /ORGANISM="Genus nov. species nov., Strain RCC2339" /LENGTH=497 /DNA_ID=CAMNT_0007145617 /DNA_START=125 /DNA_END=1618 /DNA_ORIENTATION=+